MATLTPFFQCFLFVCVCVVGFVLLLLFCVQGFLLLQICCIVSIILFCFIVVAFSTLLLVRPFYDIVVLQNILYYSFHALLYLFGFCYICMYFVFITQFFVVFLYKGASIPFFLREGVGFLLFLLLLLLSVLFYYFQLENVVFMILLLKIFNCFLLFLFVVLKHIFFSYWCGKKECQKKQRIFIFIGLKLMLFF